MAAAAALTQRARAGRTKKRGAGAGGRSPWTPRSPGPRLVGRDKGDVIAPRMGGSEGADRAGSRGWGEREVRAAQPRGGGWGARRFEAREGRGILGMERSPKLGEKVPPLQPSRSGSPEG